MAAQNEAHGCTMGPPLYSKKDIHVSLLDGCLSTVADWKTGPACRRPLVLFTTELPSTHTEVTVDRHTGCVHSATHLGTGQTPSIIHVLLREDTHTHTHRRHHNEIHPFNMHSLPDRDNIKARLGRERSCHSSLGKLGYREDPLLRPFISEHRRLPVGLWSAARPPPTPSTAILKKKKEWWGTGCFTEKRARQTKAGDEPWQVVTCVPTPLLPSSLHHTVLYAALLQHHSNKDRRPSGEQAPKWWIGFLKKSGKMPN